jgi:UDP-glucuronate 4-epimerase
MLSRLFSKRRTSRESSGPAGCRAYAIGDVHGRLDLLVDLLARIDEDNKRRPPAKTWLIFLGDLVDRGPDSRGVVELLANRPPAFARNVFLKGNHEEFFLGVRPSSSPAPPASSAITSRRGHARARRPGDRVDNVNDYYSVELKRDRLAELGRRHNGFEFRRGRFRRQPRCSALDGRSSTASSISAPRPGCATRSRIRTPTSIPTWSAISTCSSWPAPGHPHFVYASSSSVYGGNDSLPFRVEDRVDHPLSLYAATKKADELMSETYAHLYRLPQTGLRFFTVYGPWGRPDMAMWLFTKAILAGEPIEVFGEGNMRRDFTYVDDIVSGVVACLDNPPPDDGARKPAAAAAPHRLYNIGNNRSEELMRMIG